MAPHAQRRYYQVGSVRRLRGLEGWPWPAVALALSLSITIAGCRTGTSIPLQAIPGVTSASPIILATSASSSGYHLVWASEDQGVNYQRLDLEAMEWSPVQAMSHRAAQRVAIAGEGSTVHLFWSDSRVHHHRSLDGGRTWQDLSLLSAAPASSIEHLSASVVGDAVHLLYGNQNNLFYRRGASEGTVWSDTETLASSASHGLAEGALAGDATGDVHVVWSDYDLLSGQGALYHRVRPNSGSTWLEPEPLFISQESRISQPSITPSDQELIVAWLSGGMPHFTTIDGDEAPIESVSGAWPLESSHQSFVSSLCGQRTACLAWIDKQDARKEWWGNLPLYEIFTAGKKDPYWADNDIYLHPLEQKSRRLTPALSYSHTLDLAMGQRGPLLVWSGHADVGRTLDEIDNPHAIYWQQLEAMP